MTQKTTNKTMRQQAIEYVQRVGVAEAKRSNHYLTAKRHCVCGTCFCCEVMHATEAAIFKAQGGAL